MDTLDNMNEENEPRPRFLTVLCILTFIATGLGLISGLFNLLITGKHTPKEHRPSIYLKTLSILGIVFLIGFSVWFLTSI